MKYALYLFNILVAVITFKDDMPIAVVSCNNSLLPFGSYKLINNKYFFNIVTFKSWWFNRIIPDTRNNIRRLLQNVAQNTVSSLVLFNLGVSLTDCYWLRPLDKSLANLSWDYINLYTNNFIVNIGFKERYAYKSIKDISPDTTLNGNLPKFWLKRDNSIFLYKGTNNNKQRIANEIFASYLHKKQGKQGMVDYVPYTAEEYNCEIFSCCSNICSITKSMAFARDFLNECKRMDNQIEYYNLVSQLEYYGLTEQRINEFFDYMILSDFVLTNSDRHMNNIGILYNPVNKQVYDFAPLYDFGDSMFYNYIKVPRGNVLLNIETSSFYKYEVNMLKLVKNSSALDIKKLPNKDEFFAIYERFIDDKQRIADLFDGYCLKISLLAEFQKGNHIWHRRRTLKCSK